MAKNKVLNFPFHQNKHPADRPENEADFRNDETVPVEQRDLSRDGQTENSEEDLSQMGLRQLFSILPNGLLKVVVMQFTSAAVCLVISILLVILYKVPQCLLGVGLAGWLLWMGFSVMLDYQAGKIVEKALLCVSVQRLRVQNKTRVTFRTTDEYPTYFEYFLPGSKGNDFLPNVPYIIYVRESTPQILLGYQAL